MPSLTFQTGGSAASGGGVSVEALQKKLVSLQKDLAEAIKTPSKEGQAKAKLIQMQIEATQAQLDQLLQQKAKASAEKQPTSQQVQHASNTIKSNEKSGSSHSIVDVYVWLRTKVHLTMHSLRDWSLDHRCAQSKPLR